MMQLILNGGPLMAILVAVGIFGLVVFLERLWHLHRARIRYEDFLQGLFRNLEQGDIEEALTICEETPGPVAFLARVAILHRQRPRAELQESLDNAGRSEISRMERRLSLLATVAQLSPLIGLLGTVTAMIQALWTIQSRGPLVHAGDLAGWLMQALATTAVGLFLAIVAHGGYVFLANKVEKIVLDMERAASEIAAFLHNTAREANPSPP